MSADMSADTSAHTRCRASCQVWLKLLGPVLVHPPRICSRSTLGKVSARAAAPADAHGRGRR
eukprot:14999865-Alexandrium_andersonii.AAC.1